MKIRKATKKDLKEIDKIYVEGSIDEGKLQFPNISKKEMIADLEKHKKERLKKWEKNFLNSKKLIKAHISIKNDSKTGLNKLYKKLDKILK